MSIPQFEYYQEQGFHPDEVAVEDPSVFEHHSRVRMNLYQNLLRLPLNLFSGKDVLEIGCGTGESALVLAMHGARMSLIDADPTVSPRIDELFARFGVSDRIRRKVICRLDEYEDEAIFDLVEAEGFLFTDPNRDEMVKRLCRLIQPGGFGIISFPDRFGSFFEHLKKAMMWRAYQVEGIKDAYSQPALDIARQLFENSYTSLPNSRDFSIWWKDSLVSPFLTWDYCWDYDDILGLLVTEGCSFYSSTPRVYEPPHLTWYKSILSSAEHQAAVTRSYSARKFDLLFGFPVGVSAESPRLNELSKEVGGTLKKLSTYFRSLEQPVPVIDFNPAAQLFSDVGIENEVVPEMVEFFSMLRGQSALELIEGYAALERINSSWGCSYQYLCFFKQEEPTV